MSKNPFILAVPDYSNMDSIGRGKYLGDMIHQKLERYASFDKVYIQAEPFADGSEKVETQENVRRSEIYLVSPMHTNGSQHVMINSEMLTELKRSRSSAITLLETYNPYFSQDKRKTREPVTARDVLDTYEEKGSDYILTFDPHSETLVMASSHNCPLEALPLSGNLAVAFRKLYELDNCVVASPDVGGYPRAELFANLLGLPLIGVRKVRYGKDKTKALEIIGDIKQHVEGKDIIFRDDVLRTAGSLETAAQLVKKYGAKSVRACLTHFDPSGEAYKRLYDNDIGILVTNTVPPIKKPAVKAHKNFAEQNIKVLDISDTAAQIIAKESSGGSLRGFFDESFNQIGNGMDPENIEIKFIQEELAAQ